MINLGLAGKEHIKDDYTLAIDIGTYGKSLPIVTNEYETFYTDTSFGYTSGAGYNISLYTDYFIKTSKHLQTDSKAYKQMQVLNSLASKNGIFKFELPPNYQYSNVGISGDLGTSWTGPHLHQEYKRR